MSWQQLPYLDLIALCWFVGVWVGYTLFAKRRAREVSCLSYELRRKRTAWMEQMLIRDNKMADVALISTLERNVSFFASSSMLILAGLLTALASSDKIAAVLMQVMPWLDHVDGLLQFKILCLVLIYVFTFFQFTWSLRQYGFGGVLIGAAPDGRELPPADLYSITDGVERWQFDAGNAGLREDYRARFAAHEAEFAELCRQTSVRFGVLPTDTPVRAAVGWL